MREIYLDNSATTQVAEPAAKAVYEMLVSCYGNPSSLHLSLIHISWRVDGFSSN